MAIGGMDEKERRKAELDSRVAIEQLSAPLKDLILSQPPQDLLGRIYGRMLLHSMSAPDAGTTDHDNSNSDATKRQEWKKLIDDNQFLLEFVHAVLASFEQNTSATLSEEICEKIFSAANELRSSTLFHCMFTSADTDDGVFGPKTGEVEYLAKSNWVMMRGNRYQVLEEEFFDFVLEPHDEALGEAYGIGSEEIAAGFQSIANSVRTGHMQAVEQIAEQMKAAQEFAAERGLTMEQAADAWRNEQPERLAESIGSFNDLFRGGICNLSKHTELPPNLLADLSFDRGEDAEFFAPGPYCGTPLRTLPARKKPLVKLDDEYFAVDPCFVRDSGYRALLWNLLQRRPEYKKEFESRQKQMSEAAFHRVFDKQLDGALIQQEIWYKDPVSRQWVENDALIRLDDVLILVEAKAGAAATIASPALDFERHVRSIQDLVIKAYDQCRRFFDYLDSAREVPLFRRTDNRYVETDRIRVADYRVLIPIGLTVESFSPFSTMCKELPELEPILGSHPFVSLSIDDLFVLNRFLPTAGELMHYLEVRQSVAGIRGTRLFDEIDHLGAYISNNRFDETLRDQVSQGADMVVWDGMSEIVDQHFEREDWDTRQPPKQECPEEVLGLLAALNSTKAPGWLSADSQIRNYGLEGRQNLASVLRQLRGTLANRSSRYFSIAGNPPLFVWLQRAGSQPNRKMLEFKAKAAAIAAGSPRIIVVLASASPDGGYSRAERIFVDVPDLHSPENAEIFAEAERMKSRQVFISDSDPS